MQYDVIIIGAGVIGGMIARTLSAYHLNLLILEKESDVSMGASKANSGIIHGGYDPIPGTLKATLNTQGTPLLFQAARELCVPHEKNGSMVLAFTKEDEKHLEMLLSRGKENGISDLRILSGEEARRMEPNLSKDVISALLVPGAGIISPYELTIAAVGNAMDNGAELRLDFEVSHIEKEKDLFRIFSAEGEVAEGKILINCAGTYSDRIAKMAGDGFFKIIPRRGEYLLLDRKENPPVHHTLFFCPSEKGKGILVSPTVHKNTLLGPTADPVFSPNNTETSREGGILVEQEAKRMVPSLDLRQVITSFAGVRASEKDGDFIIQKSEKVEKLFHVAAIDSPGLSCCVSIAHLVRDLLEKDGLKLVSKKDYDPCRPDPHAFQKMSLEEKDRFIKANPDFGTLVCRCEKISKGEILLALRQNPPARTLDGVKRRTRSGMGRCQGGFCTPTILGMIAKEKNCSLEEVRKFSKHSNMVWKRGK